MGKCLPLLILVAVALVLPVAGYASTYTGGTGLIDTPHDFVMPEHSQEFGIPQSRSAEDVWSFTAEPTPTTGSAIGLCTFCHTPHKATQQALLWNHTLSTLTYNWGDATTTVGGTTLPTNINSWAGPSKFCLSCHDGSVAIGDIAWYQGAPRTGTAKLSGFGGMGDTHPTGKYNIGGGGDMSGNHPVAVPLSLRWTEEHL